MDTEDGVGMNNMSDVSLGIATIVVGYHDERGWPTFQRDVYVSHKIYIYIYNYFIMIILKEFNSIVTNGTYV